MGVIESLKNGNPKLMAPVVIQLLILLWKMDNRTYSFLHKMLYDESYKNLGLEMNISKAIACREICRLAPHLHGKDVVSVLSLILNESAGSANGLPSAIAIEAIIELCKAYVIDVSGSLKFNFIVLTFLELNI